MAVKPLSNVRSSARPDRIGVVNINYFSLRLEKKRYVHMRYLSAARSRPLYYPARIGRLILS